MKAVLLSIQPKWCELIASGKKTVEVRKTKPKLEVPFKVYIYETQGRTEIPFVDEEGHTIFKGRGQVIGEFVCDRIDEYRYGVYDNEFVYHIPTAEGEKTCMEYTKAEEYGNGKPLYFWHISNLVIYDKPRELGELKKVNRECWYADLGLAKMDCPECKNADCFIQRPPQSWCYVEGVN